ncbi:MAG: helix-turn-helix domain-containing protein [Deltaproteobacteria bacterium]|uniref:Helix-turn-helix domain-containing protein n=1 Tax=Candidatus Desulfacyla euxinica TaxID=2841693 RepID=A0A8J6T7A8_9DELT|nr:helix-turn-helix domain-containing protein [Candidatus Desulfacyla euxinica]MBL7216873.1 helix-turn-helix domain-containing protein [Desulfobacteraceae bacterium]
MDIIEFKSLRNSLHKTQKELAQLLGVSLKAVHSYEQGWRSIPTYTERQILFLVALKKKREGELKKPCWTLKKCPAEIKSRCPAKEFDAGKFCWFINGTICEGIVHKNWQEKMKVCRSCDVFLPLLDLLDGKG